MKTYDKTKGKSALYLLVFLLACIIYYQQEKLYENIQHRTHPKCG